MKKEIIDAIETKLGYEFKDKGLLIQAFTRESYAKEQRVKGVDCQSNEQLEYFGDSVLNYLVVCGQLDHFTKVMDGTGLHVLYKEGKLSEFNSHWTDKTMLSDCIDALELAQFLIMSKGDINQKAYENKSVKEDLFESLVGAMWIDSDKDISRIEAKVFKMLGITFDLTNVEKNYVSQLVEYADKNKYHLKKDVNEVSEGYEVKYTISLTDLLNLVDVDGINEQDWSATGIGRNIKAAEQAAAKELIAILNNYGWFKKKNMPDFSFDTNNAINVLQELNQKGYIGEITYSDSLEFSTERKPYWRVECKIANYVTTFTGTNESKKLAKKDAAYAALLFIKHVVNKNDGYNSAYKHFKFLVNTDGNDEELKVFVIDNMDGNFSYSGHLFPGNKLINNFDVNASFMDENMNMIDAFEDPIKAVIEWTEVYSINKNINDKNKFKLYLEEEYNKLTEDIKKNGVLLREKLIEIVNNF